MTEKTAVVEEMTAAEKQEHEKKKQQILESHPEFELTYDMMLGLRYTMDYTMDLCGDVCFLEFISNSKSGQFFFFSHNRKYMIKTQTEEEVKLLIQIMPKYFEYIARQTDSFLVKFFGLHQVKTRGSSMYFVIMNSIFPSKLPNHLIFDLKGSTHGRCLTEKELKDEKSGKTVVLKDLDMINRHIKVRLPGGIAEKVKKQLKADSDLMAELGIMDYSLLLGIHYCERYRAERVVQEKKDAKILELRKFKLKDLHDLEAMMNPHQAITKKSVAKAVEKPNSEKKAEKKKSFSSMKVQTLEWDPKEGREHLAARETFSFQAIEEIQRTRTNTRAAGSGPISLDEQKAENLDGIVFRSSDNQEIYRMGIIDILQKYNARKKMEHWFKSITLDGETISAVKPERYANRFDEYLEDKIIDEKAFHSIIKKELDKEKEEKK